MRFVKGAEVFTSTGKKLGILNRIIIDAKTRDATDLVIERGTLFKDEKVIPVGLVDLENGDRIMLRETDLGVDEFPSYETTHYVPLDQMSAPYENIEASYWYPPVNYQIPPGSLVPRAMPDYVLQTESNIPEGRVAIAEGAQVISQDEKHVGDVEQIVANTETHNITHLVVGKGFLLKAHKLVPAFWITEVGEHKVYLSVQADLFDKLPDYQSEA